MDITAIYLRLSKDDGDLSKGHAKLESNSITNQRFLILDYLKKFSDIKVYDIYIDE